jgi:phosphatidylglycerol lysyltransferase
VNSVTQLTAPRDISPPPTSSSHRTRYLLNAVRLALVIAACWALRRELQAVSIGELVAQFRSIGWTNIGLALLLTTLSFVMLGVVELLGLRFGAREIATSTPVRAAFGTSFVANAFSQSVGLAVLTGTAVRLRSYERYGLSSASVGQVSAFVTLTSTLGLLGVGAWAMATTATSPLGRFATVVRPAALIFALVLVGYLAWSLFGKRAVAGKGNWIVMRPTPRLALGQILLSGVDWLVTGAVLFVLLPEMPFLGLASLLRTYMVAQVVGVSSHVPAGAGVFEVVMLALLVAGGGGGQRAAIIAALVMFRVVYYLVPLCAAIAVAGASELASSGSDGR